MNPIRRQVEKYHAISDPVDFAKRMYDQKGFNKRKVSFQDSFNYTPRSKQFEIQGLLPVGIVETGELLLCPKMDVATNIGLYGEKQMGKTVGMVGLTDRIYHNWHARCFFSNDFLDISYDHRFPEKSPLFTKQLETLTQAPIGLPMVFCYPSTKTLKMKDPVPNVRLSIPFREFILKSEKWTKIGNSKKYFLELRESFLKAKSYKELVGAIMGEEAGGYGPGLPESVRKPSGGKLKSIFNSLIQEKIFSIENEESISSAKVVDPEYDDPDVGTFETDPIVALLLRNLVPCLMTSDLRSKPYRGAVFEYYMKEIYDAKCEGGVLNKYPVYAMVDELNELVDRESETIISWVTTGGNLGVGGLGLFWACQDYKKIPERIRSNTAVGFAYSQKKANADEIAGDFGLTTADKKKLIKLKRMEFMALTKDHWVLLDPTTGKTTKTNEPLRCRILPPLSMHRSLIWKSKLKAEGKPVPEDPEPVLDTNSHIAFAGQPFLIPKWYNKLMEAEPKMIVQQNVDFRETFFGDERTSIDTMELDALFNRGYGLAALPMREGYKFHKRQKYGYFLFDLDAESELPEASMLLATLPSSVKIQMDSKNKRVRLWGRDCGFKGMGSWYPIK